ncbi:hypothetical protein KBC55_00330 [Patescibacteria group bacterium]|nr:hypothetical protein [Patescibacteria group bacterium]
MPILLLIGIVLFGLPAALIIGFAAYIFWGFISDDKDARAIFNLALIIMLIGALFIAGHIVGNVIVVSP